MFTRSGLPQSTPEHFPAHIFSQARATCSPFRGIPTGIPRFWGYQAGLVAKPADIPLAYHTR
jgi:hypothetical protein